MNRSSTLPYLLLAPATVFLCVFFLYPFVLVAFEAITRDGGCHIEQQGGHAGVREVGRDLRTHRAGSKDGGGLDHGVPVWRGAVCGVQGAGCGAECGGAGC